MVIKRILHSVPSHAQAVLRPLKADSERRDRFEDLCRGYHRGGVVWNVHVESGVHLFIRVIRRCVSYHRDFVTELSGKANGRFDARLCYDSDDDER